MGNLVEICNSKYSHTGMEFLNKKYYMHLNGTKILCDECISDYIMHVVEDLAECIINCKNQICALLGDEGDYYTITLPVSAPNYMEYLLPIKFKVSISFRYSKSYEDVYSTSISSATPNAVVKMTGVANISSDVCPDIAPPFNFSLDFAEESTAASLCDAIRPKVQAYLRIVYPELPDETVYLLMKQATQPKYSSNCGCDSAKASSSIYCVRCGVSTVFESYIYQNMQYCLDCMYALVVESAVNNNISDLIGLSDVYGNTTNVAIVNSQEWKRTVISRYITEMTKLGKNPHIDHTMLTLE